MSYYKLSLPLYSKLSVAITGFALVITLGFISLALWSSDRYHQEVTQQLHKSLAQYVIDHLSEPLLLNDLARDNLVVNQGVLKSIALNTMMINPSVEVYLLNLDGGVLGHALPEATVDATAVNIAPVAEFLNGTNTGAILGDNPRRKGERSIFSAAPVWVDGSIQAYLYVVLASNEARSIATQLSDSHIVRLTVGAMFALALFFALSSFLSFRRIAQPLHQLSRQVRSYRLSKLDLQDAEPFEADEVAELQHSFELMQSRIQQQFDQLGEADRLRRELVSNVSHDLRTPLASMQGYLETLLLKYQDLDDAQRLQYVDVAHRHSRRLTDLISQLFELSKLDAGRVVPTIETFSLTELLFDIKQEYELLARQNHIDMTITVPQESALVSADISLMQRVLQNLIDNALRHTPEGGKVHIELVLEGDNQACVKVIDSGVGISKKDIPFVFQRFYQADSDEVRVGQEGAGLGLSIVKKILELHDVMINVRSEPEVETCFSFMLPRMKFS